MSPALSPTIALPLERVSIPKDIFYPYTIISSHSLPQTLKESAAHTPKTAINAAATINAAPSSPCALRLTQPVATPDASSTAPHDPAQAASRPADKLSAASNDVDCTRKPTSIDLASWEQGSVGQPASHAKETRKPTPVDLASRGQGSAWQPASLCPDFESAEKVITPTAIPQSALTAVTHPAGTEPKSSRTPVPAAARSTQYQGQLAISSAINKLIPQNITLSAEEAKIADQSQEAKQSARQQQIRQSVLAFSHAGDTPLQRISDALNKEGDPAARLRKCNGAHDIPPADRPKRATDLPGSPGALGSLPKFWNADMLEKYLQRHPNRRMVEYTLGNLRNGADLQLVLPEDMTFTDVSHIVGTDPIPEPRKNVLENMDEARRHVKKYMDANTLVEVKPGTRVIIHPIDLVIKETDIPGVFKYRLVHDMTEKKRKTSINNMTPRDLWKIEHAVHDAPAALIKAGMTVAIVRDFKSAYRSISVLLSQQCLQCFYLDGKCYASTALTFGNRAAGFIWDSLASLLQWIFEDQLGAAFGVDNICVTHTGDDFLIGLRFAAHLAAAQAMVDHIILSLGDRAGREKDQSGAQVAFIGLQVNLYEGTLSVKPERLTRLLKKFDRAVNDTSVRYSDKDLLSLAGQVSFISTHSAASLVFARGLYKQAHSPYAARGWSQLESTTRLDIKAMAHCLRRMSFLSVMPTKFAFVDTDASGKHGGAGAVSMSWLSRIPFLHFPFPLAFLTHASDEMGSMEATLHGDQKASSGLLELCAVAVTIITFRDILRGSTVIVCSDSTATVDALKSMYSALPRSAQLLKYLAALAVSHDINLAPVHRPRDYLAHVDALTHYNEDRFKELVPRAETRPTNIDPRIISFLLDPLCVHDTADIFQLLT